MGVGSFGHYLPVLDLDEGDGQAVGSYRRQLPTHHNGVVGHGDQKWLWWDRQFWRVVECCHQMIYRMTPSGTSLL